MEKKMFIAVTNREYKGEAGYEILAVSYDREKVLNAFSQWKQDRLNEFATEIDNNADVVEVVNEPTHFLYNDNNRYYIDGYVGECVHTTDVKETAFVAFVGGLSDGSDVEDYKVFATHQGATNWMKNQIFAIKAEWDNTNNEIVWDMEEKRDSIELSSENVSVDVFGFVTKMGVL